MPKRSPLPLNVPLGVAVAAWSLNFVALKLLYAEMSPPAVSVFRFAAMAALLLVICLVVREPLRIERRDWLRMALFGFLSMGVYMVLFLEGMRNTGAAEGSIILNVNPLLTILIAGLVGQERLRWATLLGATVAFAGIVLVMLPALSGGGGRLVGNALVLASAFVWASSIVLMKPLLGRYSPLRVLVLSMAPGLPVLLAYWLIADGGRMPDPLSPLGWLMFAHVALISGVVAFLCFYRGVKDSGPSGAALAMYFVPPLSALLEWAVSGRALTGVQVVGLGVVLLGVFMAQRGRQPLAA